MYISYSVHFVFQLQLRLTKQEPITDLNYYLDMPVQYQFMATFFNLHCVLYRQDYRAKRIQSLYSNRLDLKCPPFLLKTAPPAPSVLYRLLVWFDISTEYSPQSLGPGMQYAVASVGFSSSLESLTFSLFQLLYIPEFFISLPGIGAVFFSQELLKFFAVVCCTGSV